MRHALPIIAVLVAAAQGAGCAPTDRISASERRSEEAKLAVASPSVVPAAHVYTDAQKAEFILRKKAELAALETELGGFTARGEAFAGGSRIEADARLEPVRQKLALAKSRLDLTGAAAEADWEGARSALEASYAELEASLASTRTWMSKETGIQ